LDSDFDYNLFVSARIWTCKIPVYKYRFIITGFWLTWNTVKLLRPNFDSNQFKLAFYNINAFVIFIVFLISIDNLFVLY